MKRADARAGIADFAEHGAGARHRPRVPWQALRQLSFGIGNAARVVALFVVQVRGVAAGAEMQHRHVAVVQDAGGQIVVDMNDARSATLTNGRPLEADCGLPARMMSQQ